LFPKEKKQKFGSDWVVNLRPSAQWTSQPKQSLKKNEWGMPKWVSLGFQDEGWVIYPNLFNICLFILCVSDRTRNLWPVSLVSRNQPSNALAHIFSPTNAVKSFVD